MRLIVLLQALAKLASVFLLIEILNAHADVRIDPFLVEKGADANAQGGVCGNALYAASHEGYKKIA